MIYYADIVTPNTVTKSVPQRSVLKVTRGLVYRVEVEFPPGPLGNLFVSIWDGGYQCWPSSMGTFWHSDWRVISFDDLYFKNTPPYQFDILTYNEGDNHSHWCGISLALVSQEEYIARFLPGYVGLEAEKKLREAQAAQEAKVQAIIASPFPWVRRK